MIVKFSKYRHNYKEVISNNKKMTSCQILPHGRLDKYQY